MKTSQSEAPHSFNMEGYEGTSMSYTAIHQGLDKDHYQFSGYPIGFDPSNFVERMRFVTSSDDAAWPMIVFERIAQQQGPSVIVTPASGRD